MDKAHVNKTHTTKAHIHEDNRPLIALLPKALLGGVLMGLANLVPGVSGGTMLLAVGIYTVFIAAVADVTSLRFSLRSLTVVFVVAAAAVTGILLFAGTIKELVLAYRWIAYSLFIGLTLGGVPVLLRMMKKEQASEENPDRNESAGLREAAQPPRHRVTAVSSLLGFAAMAALAALQQYGGASGGGGGGSWPLLFVAGMAGASAMILPGISGGYLLLLLGQYIPILSGVDELKHAIGAGDLAGVWQVTLEVIVPVGIGLVVGVALVSNILKFLLARYRTATLGVLLGVLLGAIVGLWPFQEGVRPEPGEMFKGQVVTSERLESISPEDYPTEFFAPGAGQAVSSLLLAAAGFFATYGISRLEPKISK